MTKRLWRVAEVERAQAVLLADALRVSPILAHLLILRGAATAPLAQRFLSPRMDDLCDPFLLTDMAPSVARITQARDRAERVLVFGDYDADGVSAAAILLNGLRRFGVEDCSAGMPLRLEEGYGLNPGHVDAAQRDGVSLIITVDNGISAFDAAARARALGIDLILTDHHALEDKLPPAVAILNPRREEPGHPLRDLCGAGVAFKLATALNGQPYDLDLAALGTVADVVPLQGENRAIVSLGLRHMAKHARVGIAQLAKTAGRDVRALRAGDIAYQLGPRINAIGRLDDALAALALLLADDAEQALAHAEVLDAANEERRNMERAMYEEAAAELATTFTEARRSIVLARLGWHPGVIGVVASRVFARYHRPVVLIALDDRAEGRGSARCGPGFNMAEALRACARHLVKFGGHRAAGGFSIRESSVSAFIEAFEAEALRQLGSGPINPELSIDVQTPLSNLDSALVASLERLEPLGHMNPAPLFCTYGVEVLPGSARLLKDRHIKFQVRQDGPVFDAIAFGLAEHMPLETVAGRIDIAYTPQFNTWNGATSIQLSIKDLQSA